MANIKSQKKRAWTNQKRQLRNAGQKTEIKTAIKKVLAAVEATDIHRRQARKIVEVDLHKTAVCKRTLTDRDKSLPCRRKIYLCE